MDVSNTLHYPSLVYHPTDFRFCRITERRLYSSKTVVVVILLVQGTLPLFYISCKKFFVRLIRHLRKLTNHRRGWESIISDFIYKEESFHFLVYEFREREVSHIGLFRDWKESL